MAIRKCVCKHADQDAFHGIDMRVMNPTMKKNWRCTICGKEQAMEKELISTKKETMKK